jgi:hypothetical protein
MSNLRENVEMRGLTPVMTSVLFFLAFVLFLSAQIGDPNSAENKQWWNGEHYYKLRLSNGPLTLQECLDAGMRPRRTPGLTGHTLHFQAKIFELVLPNGESIFCENGYGRIRVTKDYQVTSISFYEEQNVSFENCRERLRVANQAYGGGRTEAEISSFLSSVEAAERHRTDKMFVVGMAKKGRGDDEYWYSSIVARNQGAEESPFRFIMRTEIRDETDKRSYKDYHRLGVLLDPPEGYEHISFTYVSPPKDPNAPLVLTPEEQSKLLAEQLKENTSDGGSSSQESQLELESKHESKPIVEERSLEPERKLNRPWIIAGVVLLGILALLFKTFKGKFPF